MPRPRSFAARLLLGGIALALSLIAVVSGFLFASVGAQTEHGAESNAANRAALLRQLLQQVTGPEAHTAAVQVAALPDVVADLSTPGAATSLDQLFGSTGAPAVAMPGIDTIFVDAHGGFVCRLSVQGDAATGEGTVDGCTGDRGGWPAAAPQSVQQALTTSRGGGEGVELLGGTPAYDVAAAVRHNGAVVGAVVYSAPLAPQLDRFAGAASYPMAVLLPGTTPLLLRPHGTSLVAAAPPQQLLDDIRGSATTVTTSYTAPGSGAVAASFVPMAGPVGTRSAAWVGVEVPLTAFTGAVADDRRQIGLITVTAVLVVVAMVLFFVHRFVRRPIGALQRGVRRIADGDYSSDIAVTSDDELGQLAVSVNRMRAQIAGYIAHIDGSITRLNEVSHALTTTTSGVAGLQSAVLAAAAALGGDGARPVLLAVDADGGFRRAAHRPTDAASLTELDGDTESELRAGRTGRARDAAGDHVLAVPMLYHDRVGGAVVLTSPRELSDGDARALATLANNAAVALENARMFEREKQTVTKLRELDSMKSDFLSTAQHELRTPILAIRGTLELLSVAWAKLDDESKVSLIHDVDASTRMLGELIETIIDFSLLSGERLDVRLDRVEVATAVDAVVEEMRARHRDAVPAQLSVSVHPGLVVSADPQRFSQALRAVVDNAVKFTPADGALAISAAASPQTGYVTITVTDSGCGISAEALPHVFERFYQENNSRTRTHGGMGMGLALLERICAAHEARVRLDSAPGRGTSVTLEWPLANGAAAVAPQDAFHLKAG